ncbi:MAG: hypothetical protein HY238_07910 [Acidobacteria bacterium]|nr:hypothetical protein [Acidobacteriota bacterium]
MKSPARTPLPFLALVVALALAGLGRAAAAPPGPARVRWSVPEVSETITAGTKKAVTITLRSTHDLANVSLWMSPSLHQLVTIKPMRFDSLAANQDYEVILAFEAPAAAPAEQHGGTVHVKLGEATVPVPLTIGLRVTRRQN